MSIDGFPPGSRDDDWETSKAADRMINAKRPTLALKMLRAYEFVERTDDEAAERMGVTHTCYWKRSSELRHLRLIEPTGEARKDHAGVQRIVCRITDEGRRVLREHRSRNEGQAA